MHYLGCAQHQAGLQLWLLKTPLVVQPAEDWQQSLLPECQTSMPLYVLTC